MPFTCVPVISIRSDESTPLTLGLAPLPRIIPDGETTDSHSEQSARLRQLGEYPGGALSGAQREFLARADTYQSRTTREQIQDPERHPSSCVRCCGP